MGKEIIVSYYPIADIETDNPAENDISIPTPKQVVVSVECELERVVVTYHGTSIILPNEVVEGIYNEMKENRVQR